MKICFATNNQHKLAEVRQILGDRFEVLSLKDAGFSGDIPETHDTLEENSQEKAECIFKKIGFPTFSDDSGLEVEELSGKPGVHSAHYSGSRDSIQNIHKVLKELGDSNNRKAQFRAVVTFVDNGHSMQFEGVVEGSLSREIQGEDGFGYDPIFIPEGYNKTFAQLSSAVKNGISHRKRSIEKLADYLDSFF